MTRRAKATLQVASNISLSTHRLDVAPSVCDIMKVNDFEARIVHHEIDHLDGKLFIDLMSKLKRDRVIKKFAKIAKQSGTLPDKIMIG